VFCQKTASPYVGPCGGPFIILGTPDITAELRLETMECKRSYSWNFLYQCFGYTVTFLLHILDYSWRITSLICEMQFVSFQALCVPGSRTRGQVVGIPISRADVIISVSI
jgi:hypothetical protein